MSIFKANDIRGVYGKDLHDSDAYTLGNIFVRFTKSKTIIVGRDNRISSPALHKALLRGVTDAGGDVIDIGIIDSPGAYFASHHLKKPVIMITASHNPAPHNGFYLCHANAESIYRDNGLPKLAAMMQKHDLAFSTKKGTVKEIDIFPTYIKHIVSLTKPQKIERPLKIVVDAGNGVGAPIAEKILKHIKQIHATKLFFTSDGSFPNRAPDTSIETNLIKLGKKVRQVGADFGIAFDGDADRVAFVDEKGEAVDGSFIGAFLALHLLHEAGKGQKVVYTIGCSRIVPEIIEEGKATAIREKVGHSFVNHTMHSTRALFGIEHTGHFFYKNNFNTESAIITALLVCKLFSYHSKEITFSDVIAPYKKYYRTIEISIPSTNQEKVLEHIKKQLKSTYKRPIDTFDGLYVDIGQVWFRVRASQTESLIRFQAEGHSKTLVEKEVKKIKKIISSAINS